MERRHFLHASAAALVGGVYACGSAPAPGAPSAPTPGAPLDLGLLTPIDPGSYDRSWWNRAPVRLIQTNLREIDAAMDPEAYVRSLMEASANTLLLNVGGIVANYPTDLEFHYRNPFMKGDLVGALMPKLKDAGIRVIGRFDFSKIHESLAARRPDWLYISAEGEHIVQNGTVQTCPSRGYQQQYIFKILEEAIGRYEFDGIFFNMIGYKTYDYSFRNYGQCHCEECLKLFGPGSQLSRTQVANQLFERIHGFIKQLNPELIINTYTDVGVEMVRSESGTFLDSRYEWNYMGSDHVKEVLGSYRDLVPSNTFVHFLALQYRHVIPSVNLGRIWMLETMLHAAPLDFYVIGTLLNQYDRTFLPILRDIYSYHKTHEKLFTNMESAARVAVVRDPSRQSGDEHKGLMKLLTEEHIMYDVIATPVAGTERTPRPLEDYDVVILGDIHTMSDALVSRIDDYVSNGGKLLATGFSSVRSEGAGPGRGVVPPPPTGPVLLQSLGVEPSYDAFPKTVSTYLQVTEADKDLLGEEFFRDIDLLMVYENIMKPRLRGNAQGLMNLIENTMFGPPEKTYFLDDEITDSPGLVYNQYGRGRSVFIPWGLGSQYHFKALHSDRALFKGVMANLLNADAVLETDASPLVEMTHMVNRNGAFEWVGMINHSGQVGPSFRHPLPVGFNVKIRPARPVRQAVLMRSGRNVDFRETGDGWVEITVPELLDFEQALFLYA